MTTTVAPAPKPKRSRNARALTCACETDPTDRRVARQSLCSPTCFSDIHPSIHSAFSAKGISLSKLATRVARRPRGVEPPPNARVNFHSFPFHRHRRPRSRAHRRSRRSRPASWWVSPHPSSRGNLARHSSIHPSIHLARSRRRDDDERVDRDATHRVLLLKSTPHPLHPLHPLTPRVRRLRAPSVRPCPSVHAGSMLRVSPALDDGRRITYRRRSTTDLAKQPPADERTNEREVKKYPVRRPPSDDHRPTSRSDARPMDDRCVGTRAPTVSTASARAFRHEFFNSKRFGLLDRTLIVLNR